MQTLMRNGVEFLSPNEDRRVAREGWKLATLQIVVLAVIFVAVLWGFSHGVTVLPRHS